jgi:hypothetical protein
MSANRGEAGATGELANPNGTRVGAAGRAFVLAHHDWAATARDLSVTLTEL